MEEGGAGVDSTVEKPTEGAKAGDSIEDKPTEIDETDNIVTATNSAKTGKQRSCVEYVESHM